MISVFPYTTIVVNWFHQKQGLALGIAAVGKCLGGFVIPPMTNLIIEHYDGRVALVALAALVVLFLTPPAWRCAIVAPADIGQHPDGKQQAKENTKDSPVTCTISISALIKEKCIFAINLYSGNATCRRYPDDYLYSALCT